MPGPHNIEKSDAAVELSTNYRAMLQAVLEATKMLEDFQS